MKKLTILCLHLGFGGVENAISSFANNMCDKYDITIISIYKLYKEPVYHIDNKVNIKYLINTDLPIRVDQYKKLFRKHKIGKLFKVLFHDYVNKGHIIKLFKDTFDSIKTVRNKKELMIKCLKDIDTDIILSTRVELNELVSEYVDDSIYKLAWEHNHGDIEYIRKVIKSASKMDKLILVSKELYKIYSSETNDRLKCVYIPNVIDNIPDKVSLLNNNNLISVGRLEKEKGQLSLIDVVDNIYKANKDIRLTLIGDGDEKKNIINYIKSKNLENVITLTGYKDKEYINKALYNSSLFLLTSYTESFGIVLIEAMASGVPCLSYTSAEGANEIIEDNNNGYLIPNRDSKIMADKVNELLKDRKKLKELGQNAYKTSLKYTKEVVYKEWEEALKSN